MFTQAGFNWRRRSVCRAFVRRADRRWTRAATLVAFYDVDAKRYTEYAWGGGRDRFSWPHQVRICTLPELYRVLDVMLMALGVDRLESCQLPE